MEATHLTEAEMALAKKGQSFSDKSSPRDVAVIPPYMNKQAGSIHVPSKHGTFEFHMHDWSMLDHRVGDGVCGPDFSINHEDVWRFEVFPTGRDAVSANYLSVILHHVNEEPVRAHVRITLVNHRNASSNIHHTAPTRIYDATTPLVLDQIISYGDTLNEELGFTQNDMLTLSAEITVIGDVEIFDHYEIPPAAKPIPTLSSDLSALINGYHSDITLTAGTNRVDCHQCILAARSPVFKYLFEHTGFRLKLAVNAGKHAIQKHLDPLVLHPFVMFIYTDTCSDEELASHAALLMRAASYYCLPGLQYLCTKALIQQLTIENCSATLTLAFECNAEILRHVTLKFITDNLPEVVQTEGYAKLPADLCRDIVGSTLPTHIPAETTTGTDEASMERDTQDRKQAVVKEKAEHSVRSTAVEMREQQSPEKIVPPVPPEEK